MNEIQKSLEEILNKFGKLDYKNRLTAKIPLHHNGYLRELSQRTREIVTSLPYNSDDTDSIKYAQKHIDQIWNLEVWKNANS